MFCSILLCIIIGIFLVAILLFIVALLRRFIDDDEDNDDNYDGMSTNYMIITGLM